METEVTDGVPATSMDDVPDDLLERILLRLDSPIFLIRAASTCKRWRGIIADDGGVFLCRARLLHPPTIVGHYHHRHLEQPPPPPSIEFVPTSPAPIDTSFFSLDFLLHLGKTYHLEVVDCHGGLILLQRLWPSFLVVCDPLTCRYRKVNIMQDQMIGEDFFLLDGEDGTISSSNFRVLLYDEPRSSAFSTADGGNRWRSVPPPKYDLETEGPASFAGRVEGSLYMGTECGTMMVLDNTTLEFNKVHLPSRVNALGLLLPSKFCVIAHCAGGDSTSPPTPRIVHVKCDELEVFRRVHGSDGEEWVLEHRNSRLPDVFGNLPGYPKNQCDWVRKVVVGGVGFVVLLMYNCPERWWPFSVCLDTMEVKAVPELIYRGTRDCFIYTLPWPPVMRACIRRMSQR